MIDSTDRLETPAARTAPTAPAAAPPGAGIRRERFAGRIPGILALGVGASWVVMLSIVFGLQPAVDPNEPVSLLGIVIGDLLTLSLLVGAVGLGMRRRWGLGASLGGGLVLLFGAVACQLTGHTGMWLAAQYVAGGALTAFSWGGLKAT